MPNSASHKILVGWILRHKSTLASLTLCSSRWVILFQVSPGKARPNIGDPFPFGQKNWIQPSSHGGECKKKAPLSLCDCCDDKKGAHKSFLQQPEQTLVKVWKASHEPKQISWLCPQKGMKAVVPFMSSTTRKHLPWPRLSRSYAVVCLWDSNPYSCTNEILYCPVVKTNLV